MAMDVMVSLIDPVYNWIMVLLQKPTIKKIKLKIGGLRFDK